MNNNNNNNHKQDALQEESAVGKEVTVSGNAAAGVENDSDKEPNERKDKELSSSNDSGEDKTERESASADNETSVRKGDEEKQHDEHSHEKRRT